MQVFEAIQNPVVAYFDDKKEAARFENIRAKGDLMNKTKIVIFHRNNTWSFGILPKIKEVIMQPGYPKHHPNTVIAEYLSIGNLKYESVQNETLLNPFKTKYFAWVDIGVYRNMTSSKEIKPFHIYLPECFDSNKIAYNQVAKPRPVNDKDIFFKNLNLVGSGIFLGEINTMKLWVQQYMNYTEMFLEKGLANTDQQVLYAMQNNHSPPVKLQGYVPRGAGNIWFYLANVCKNQGTIKFGNK
jgi:hypothetical protein